MKTVVLFLVLAIASMTSTAQQKHCAGINAKGLSCRNTVTKDSSYCRLHDPNTPRCGADTRKGTRCKIIVANDGDFCSYHKDAILKSNTDKDGLIHILYRQDGKVWALDLFKQELDSLKRVLKVN